MTDLIIFLASVIPVVFGFFVIRKLDDFFLRKLHISDHHPISSETDDDPLNQFYPHHNHRC